MEDIGVSPDIKKGPKDITLMTGVASGLVEGESAPMTPTGEGEGEGLG